MFRAADRSSSGVQNVFETSGLYTHVLTGRSSSQPGQRPVTTWVYKPEAANKVWSS
jgi:hypothetical protein